MRNTTQLPRILLVLALAAPLANCAATDGRETVGQYTGLSPITTQAPAISDSKLDWQETPCRDYAKSGSADSPCQLAKGKKRDRRKYSENGGL